MEVIPEQVRCLKPEAEKMLRGVKPSNSGYGLLMYPCEVQLDRGAWLDRVYVVDAQQYIKVWGIWPWRDGGKNWIPAERISAIRTSPQRLPPEFANEIYSAGESGMGYCAFSVELKDGRRLYFVTGNAVDFPSWPAGVRPTDVCRIVPHDRMPEHRFRMPTEHESVAHYSWSPFRH